MLARSCQAVPAVAGFVISSEGISLFLEQFMKCEATSKVTDISHNNLCSCYDFANWRKPLIWRLKCWISVWNVSEMCGSKGITSSPFCFRNWVCPNAWSGTGGMGIRLVVVTTCLLQCHGLTEDILWHGRCIRGKCPLLVPISTRGWGGLGRLSVYP